jgi:hypothetical protein
MLYPRHFLNFSAFNFLLVKTLKLLKQSCLYRFLILRYFNGIFTEFFKAILSNIDSPHVFAGQCAKKFKITYFQLDFLRVFIFISENCQYFAVQILSQ